MRIAGLDAFRTHEDLETKIGKEIEVAPGVFFTILRAGGGNHKFIRTYSRIIRPYERQMRANKLDVAIANRLLAEIYAQSIVIGWRGLVNADTGEEVSFSIEKCEEFLTDYPEIQSLLQKEAEDIGNFQEEEAQAIADHLGNG